MKIKIRGFSEWIFEREWGCKGKKLNARCGFEAKKDYVPFWIQRLRFQTRVFSFFFFFFLNRSY